MQLTTNLKKSLVRNKSNEILWTWAKNMKN